MKQDFIYVDPTIPSAIDSVVVAANPSEALVKLNRCVEAKFYMDIAREYFRHASLQSLEKLLETHKIEAEIAMFSRDDLVYLVLCPPHDDFEIFKKTLTVLEEELRQCASEMCSPQRKRAKNGRAMEFSKFLSPKEEKVSSTLRLGWSESPLQLKKPMSRGGGGSESKKHLVKGPLVSIDPMAGKGVICADGKLWSFKVSGMDDNGKAASNKKKHLIMLMAGFIVPTPVEIEMNAGSVTNVTIDEMIVVYETAIKNSKRNAGS